MFTNEELVSLNILCRVYVEARSHDGKYYSRNSMTAIHAGLDRFLNKENTNYTMFTDRAFITDSILTVFKPANAALNAHLVELAREVKILSTKHKPAMIPRDIEIFYEKKQVVLEQQVQSPAIVSNVVAGWLHSKSSEQRKRSRQNHPVAFFSTAGSASTSSQVVFGWSISPQLYFQHKVLLQLNTR